MIDPDRQAARHAVLKAKVRFQPTPLTTEEEDAVIAWLLEDSNEQ